MKKLIVLFALSAISFGLPAQSQVIQFEENLNWVKLCKKASESRRLLLLVCFSENDKLFAEMGKSVFTDSAVSKYLNARFVAAKMPAGGSIDGTGQLEGFPKEYEDLIRDITRRGAMPAFLFFSDNGRLVHRGAGNKNADDFVRLVNEALNPATQYNIILAKYLQGHKDYDLCPYLAYTSYELQDTAVGFRIAKDYIRNYLFKLTWEELMAQANIEFMEAFSQSSKDDGFRFFFANQRSIDSVMRSPGYARNYIERVITKEEIDPLLYKEGIPVYPAVGEDMWKIMAGKISRKYDPAFAYKTVLFAQIRWYETTKDWKNYCKCVMERVEKFGPYFKIFPDDPSSLDWKLNSVAWDLFEHCEDPEFLAKALSFSEKSMQGSTRTDGQYIDTYANILYKMGRVKEAISWEEKALTENSPLKETYQKCLMKMKSGEPTWPLD